MVKRKSSTNGDISTKSNKKVKKTSESNNNSELGKCNCSTPETVLSSLLGSHKLNDFFKNMWEKKHLHIKRGDSSYYGNIFSLDIMKEILTEQDLLFESDVNVCRYVNGEKEILNEEGELKRDAFETLMNDKKATFQVHQPQRFSDSLWNIMEKLETYFGSLVGSNVYITPASSQGLAPHCDDVEIIVLQLEGKKTWKLYKPMVELSRDYTQDLLENDIGEPFFEETLEPGDLLYFPRGTIHQAKTTDDAHSLHISISTYQQNTWGDFMNHAVTQAIENALEDNVEIRSGLPVNYLSFLGTGKNMGKYIEDETEENDAPGKKKLTSNDKDQRVVEFKQNIKTYLSKLIDHIDVNTAADSMSMDFMASRLPPYGHAVQMDDSADHKVPTLNDKIKIKYPEHMRIAYSNDDGSDEDDDMLQMEDEDDDSENEEDEKVEQAKTDEKPAKKKTPKKADKRKSIKSETENDDDEDDEDVMPGEEEPCMHIIHSLNNERDSHMTGHPTADFGGVLKLPVYFANAAVALLESKDYVCVKDLALEEDDDKLHLSTTLFSDDLIEVQSL